MNDVPKLPPAMRILRVPAFVDTAAAAALSATGRVFLVASAAVPNADETTKCLRSMGNAGQWWILRRPSGNAALQLTVSCPRKPVGAARSLLPLSAKAAA